MITLTRLNGQEFGLNSSQIVSIETCPDTRIELVNGKQLYVQEPPQEIAERMRQWLRSINSSGGP